MFYKCKMCGAKLEASNNKSVVSCDFCGSQQTVPLKYNDEENISILHNRANSLRLENKFDHALLVYENIVTLKPDDIEAHWGILLCQYGVEYVDDEKSKNKIPTCHRTELQQIQHNSHFKFVLENADVVARNIYEKEAEQISQIQKSILVISQAEKPFDIFISYKEVDEKGRRTKDSVLAQEIYNELVKSEYRVFFSRISLESKIGSLYEPYIFSALNSAKVMLIIGTKLEYINAVWVKNEWSRFLTIMNNDKGKKYLIPCYKDMDAYDLPRELLSFQAQDMSKLGFIQDLVYGIDKIFNRRIKPTETKNENDLIEGVNRKNVESILRRSEILIKAGDYKKAEEVIDNVLNYDPENVKAYLLLTLIEAGIQEMDLLVESEIDLLSNTNFKIALSLATGEQFNYLNKLGNQNREYTVNLVNEKTYLKALKLKDNKDYLGAIGLLQTIKEYKDSERLIDEWIYIDKCERYYSEAQDFVKAKQYQKAIDRLEPIRDYKDSAVLIEKYKIKVEIDEESIYKLAFALIEEGEFAKAKVELLKIENYKNVDELLIILSSW